MCKFNQKFLYLLIKFFVVLFLYYYIIMNLLDVIDKKYIMQKSLDKIKENISVSSKPGMLIASPSLDPPYKYHWIRDSAVVMRVFINDYQTTKSKESLLLLIDYINNEYEIQNLDTIGSLGEPKINLNGTAFDGPWGRPQNDGPALRGSNMIKLYNLLLNDYNSICKNIILPIIKKDLNYILNNYNKVCFDLWEEQEGWHFYTRMVQFKFLKDSIDMIHDNKLSYNKDVLNKAIFNLSNSIKHHYQGDVIISSFNSDGEITKVDDAANLFAYTHIDYDEKILKIFPIEKTLKTCDNLHSFFNKKYETSELNMIGRYAHDKYYDGQTWIICSLVAAQIYTHLNNNNEAVNDIINTILEIDLNLDISEQYNPITKEQMSAKKLTWNYAELYSTLKLSLR